MRFRNQRYLCVLGLLGALLLIGCIDEHGYYSINARYVTGSPATNTAVDFSADIRFVEPQSLSVEAETEVVIDFSSAMFDVNEFGDTDDLRFVLFDNPEQFQVTIDDYTFGFNGRQTWEDCILTIDCLDNTMAIRVRPDSPLDNMRFTLNGAETLMLDIQVLPSAPQFSVIYSNDLTQTPEVSVGFASTVRVLKIKTQLVYGSEFKGRATLSEMDVQSRCATKILADDIELSPIIAAADELFDISGCDNYNAAFVQFEYEPKNYPRYKVLQNDFILPLILNVSSRYKTLLVPIARQ